jgi:Tol biopolymer transport system component
MNRLLFLVLIGFGLISCSQSEKNFLGTKDAYFGLTTPGLIPEVFAPGIVSDTSWQEHCQIAISPKGDEIYWSKFANGDTEQIYFSKFINNKWTEPKLADFIKDNLTLINGQPTFSPNGKKLFFYSRNRPGGLGYIDAWYVERTDNGWSKPINVGQLYNTDGDDRPPIITEKGNAYTMGRNFTEDKVNYLKFNYTDGKFSTPTTVSIYKDFPYWWPLYVSPDETYIIFSSVMEEGFGGLDLYICFKDENDTWEKPINLGPEINTKTSERFPVVSPDGKYLFFMRHTETWDIFWVSTNIIENFKTQ